jgi:DNA-binding NtrC family response regulator
MQRPISMLIADDSQVTVQLLAEAARLSKLPLRLSTTDNGRDCLTLLNGSNIDLAFIDVHMPELSGTEAFWSARKLGVKTFVTLMSSPPASEAVDMAIRLKAYEFLFKPFALNDALAIINTYARISSPTKALIVDDSLTVRQIVQKILQGSVFNCEIAEAGDGETALRLVRAGQFDVVFLDCNMPGMGGLATMKRLALLRPSLKIVMISSERNAGNEIEALDGGASAFLHKPFNSQDVDRVLHAAFGLRSPNLKVSSSAPSFDVAIEGSTIRLAHRKSGHVFEYLWCEKPPYLRNGIVHPAARAIAPIAEKTALLQLRSARLLAA